MYGKGEVKGYLSQDQVCLSDRDDACVKDYKLLTINYAKDFAGLKADGVLGLAPSNQGGNSNLFIDELYNAGVVKQKTFGFYLAPYTETSRIIIGGIDMKYANTRDESQIQWLPLIDTDYWSVNMGSVQVGEETLPITTTRAIIDSGTSWIALPPSKQ